MSIDQDADVRGDQALALGALAAGVSVVTGYPGAPATGVFDHLLAITEPEQVHVQWAPNEKVAMEIAFGASLAGSLALVVLKSVEMNIAIDPLATMSLSGCHGGLVILLGDDPGGWASSNEQDSRWAARVAEVPLVEPTSVEQAASLMVQAYAWSESLGTPVIVHVTRALSLAKGRIPDPWQLPRPRKRFLRKRNRWVVLPALVVRRHHSMHRRLRQMEKMLEATPYDVNTGQGLLGVVAVGYAHTKLLQTLGDQASGFRILGLSSSWPLPEHNMTLWLRRIRHLLVLEEGGPFVEQQIRALAHRAKLKLEILGKEDRVIPQEGELTQANIAKGLSKLKPGYQYEAKSADEQAMPSKVPLCDDCPYRPTFEALLQAMERHGGRQHHVVIGETGCMIRANLAPMELFDVKYSLGSGLGLGLGLALRDTRHHVIALLGDSSFFHSDINAMPYAVQLDPPLTVIVLDNDTTALTGGQPHTGSTTDERGRRRKHAALARVIRGCGIKPQLCTPDDTQAMGVAFDEAFEAEGLRVIVVRGPCPRYT